jgi:ATP:ADP antiporter, AAA family
VLRWTVGGSRSSEHHREIVAIAAMMSLYFLVVLSVGILRPVRASLALDGLAPGDFYQVYLVSAGVIAFVPLVNRLSDRIPWQRLIPAIACFFGLNLVAFRALYVDGSTVFGFAFYGWYDLFAAVLVTQFFIIAQLFFHARLAKNAYPLIIAGGALGATIGAGLSGFLAERLGTQNLMLVAAIPIALFAAAIPIVWSVGSPVTAQPERHRPRRVARRGGRLGTIAADRQVQLIAATVLIIILVKQIVDYQFQTITKEIFVDRDAVTAFQGKFYAATQWLPLLALAGMRPLLRWRGVGLVVLIFPVAMLLTNVGLVLFWGLWVAVAAKGAETTLRYSVERATREILYVPIPDDLKLKAKNYIDAALERGAGKLASALVIGLVVGVLGLQYQHVAWVGAGLAIVWILMALRVRREYVQALARSVNERFASFRGASASLDDPATVAAIRDALRGEERQAAFGLKLLEEVAGEAGIRFLASELTALLAHPHPALRARALALLARSRAAVQPESIRERLYDPEPTVREAAVLAHCSLAPSADELVHDLLHADEADVRTAVLTCLARGDLNSSVELRESTLSELKARYRDSADGAPGERIERALVAAVLRPPDAAASLEPLMADPDPRVARTAIWSAALIGDAQLHPRLAAALARPETRSVARDGLISQGNAALPVLIARLLDEWEAPAVRRQIPSILGRMPSPETVQALVRCVLAAETDQILDHRALKALSKLRAGDPELTFDAGAVSALLEQCLDASRRYAQARHALAARDGESNGSPLPGLLAQAVNEAWAERREEVFRCLGLRYAPDEVHRAFLGVTRGETVSRANALEWLENTVGYRLFQRLEPVLGENTGKCGTREFMEVLKRLASGQDRWTAHLALLTARHLGGDHADAAELADPKLSTTRLPRSHEMNLVETVLLLQKVDILRAARSEHLALVASIAEEIDVDAGATLLRKGEPGDALFVVVRGEVLLESEEQRMTITEGQAVGTWAVIDDVPNMLEATAAGPARVLRIWREDFHALLTDHPELAIGMLQGLARRIRGLVA